MKFIKKLFANLVLSALMLLPALSVGQVSSTIPTGTIMGNASGFRAASGALTTLPAAVMPAYNGDITCLIGTALCTVNGSTAPSFVVSGGPIQAVNGFTNTTISSNPQAAPTTDIGNVPYLLMQSGAPFIASQGCSLTTTGTFTSCSMPATTFASAWLYIPATILAPATTITGVAITGTAGQFSCTCTGLVVGQNMTITGTYGGTGSITGYANPTTYYVSATNGTSTFTLQTAAQVAIVTTAGTPTGLTYSTPGSTAGFYAATFTGTQAGAICSPIVKYVSGTPPALSSSCGTNTFVPNTTGVFNPPSTILAGPTVTLAAGLMGANGCVTLSSFQVNDTTAATKTMTISFGATTFAQMAPTTFAGGNVTWKVCNRGVTTAQTASGTGTFAATTGAVTSTAPTSPGANTGNSLALSISMTNSSVGAGSYQIALGYTFLSAPN